MPTGAQGVGHFKICIYPILRFKNRKKQSLLFFAGLALADRTRIDWPYAHFKLYIASIRAWIRCPRPDSTYMVPLLWSLISHCTAKQTSVRIKFKIIS